MKHLTHIPFSLVGLLVLLPFFVVSAVAILLYRKGGVFFLQTRLGKDNKDFKLFKFRTMGVNAGRMGQLTIGGNDSRISRLGYFLFRYKLDELPQLINVLLGNISLVGRYPEVCRYVDLYTPGEHQVLSIKPALMDYTSTKYVDESELLAKAENSGQFYLKSIMPNKLAINLTYIENRSLWMDMGILFKTISKILS